MQKWLEMTMAAAPPLWLPFPSDWAQPRRWGDYMWRNPDAIKRALGGLKRALPDRLLFAQNFAGHQLGRDFVFRRERWRLLEAGWVLARLPTLDDYSERLLDPNAYAATCAELQAGLLLCSMGFRILRDPANWRSKSKKEARVPGPDWFARKARHGFNVEVTCPAMSEQDIARERAATEFLLTAQSLLGYTASLEVAMHLAFLPEVSRGSG